MRAFRIGYILTLSFLLILMVITMTFGFFPAPKGPKAPQYPSYPDYSYSSDYDKYDSSEYKKELQKYEEEREKYDKEQKTFVQDKIVPYVRNVFVSWVVLVLLFQILGLFLAKFGSAFVGAAYSFSGLWAIIFGPLSGIIWAAASLVSSFSRGAEAEFTIQPIFQAIGLACLVGVIVLTALGVLLYGQIKTMLTGSGFEPEPAPVIDPPFVSPPVSSPAAPPVVPPVAPPMVPPTVPPDLAP